MRITFVCSWVVCLRVELHPAGSYTCNWNELITYCRFSSVPSCRIFQQDSRSKCTSVDIEETQLSLSPVSLWNFVPVHPTTLHAIPLHFTPCHSLINALFHPFLHSLIQPFIHSFHSFVHSVFSSICLIHSCIHSFIHSSIISCIHSFIHPFFTQLFLHFHIHFSPFI